MLEIEKLIRMFIVGRTVSNSPLIRKFLTGMAAIIVLSIVIAMLSGALFLGIIYVIYQSLLTYGVETPIAVAITGALIVGLIAGLSFFAVKIIAMQRSLIGQLMTVGKTSQWSSIAIAFLDGFLSHRKQDKRD